MLVTCQVFGARAGKTAALRAGAMDLPSPPEEELNEEVERLYRLKESRRRLSPDVLKARVKDAMWKGVLVVRNARKLSETLASLEEITEQMKDVTIRSHRAFVDCLELENLVAVGKAVTRAALRRKESRGSHFREDYPEMDPRWNKRILLRYENGVLTEQEERAVS